MQFSIAVSKRDLLERVGAEVDDLVAQRAHVAAHEVARLVDQARRPRSSFGLAARRGQDHVEADQLLDGAVVDRLGHPPAHLALRLHGAARQLAGPQAGRRLGGAQQADHHRGGERGQEEDGLVEGEQVGVDGASPRIATPAMRAAGAERGDRSLRAARPGSGRGRRSGTARRADAPTSVSGATSSSASRSAKSTGRHDRVERARRARGARPRARAADHSTKTAEHGGGAPPGRGSRRSRRP